MHILCSWGLLQHKNNILTTSFSFLTQKKKRKEKKLYALQICFITPEPSPEQFGDKFRNSQIRIITVYREMLTYQTETSWSHKITYYNTLNITNVCSSPGRAFTNNGKMPGRQKRIICVSASVNSFFKRLSNNTEIRNLRAVHYNSVTKKVSMT